MIKSIIIDKKAMGSKTMVRWLLGVFVAVLIVAVAVMM